MPVEENGGVGTPVTPTQGGQQPGSISDLGDILLDKSLDTIQKNDFVAVTKNDVVGLGVDDEEENDPFPKTSSSSDSPVIPMVENHATIEDLQTIMLDAPSSESPFSKPSENTQVAVETPIVEESKNPLDIDLGSFDLGDLSQNNNKEAVPVENNIPVVEVPQVVVETPVVEESKNPLDIDLGDITLGTSTETTAPAVEVSAIENTIQQPTTEQPAAVEEIPVTGGNDEIQLDTAALETPTEQPAVVEEVPVTDGNDEIQLDTTALETPTEQPVVIGEVPVTGGNDEIQLDAVALETPTEQPVVVEEVPITGGNDEIQLDTVALETPTEQPAVVEEVTVEEPVIIEEVIVNNPIESAPIIEEPTTLQNNNGDTVDGGQNTTTIPETVTQAPVSADTVALEKVAEEITQGIDLDSLMVEAPSVTSTQKVEDNSPKETPIEGLKSMVANSNGAQKKVLIGLGAFAVIGLVYFGYMLISDSSPAIPTPIPTETIDEATGTNTDDIGSDTGLVETGSIDEATGTTVDGGNTSGEVIVDTGTVNNDTGSTIVDTPKTREEILKSANDIAGQVRKALIKATIQKNAQMRLSAFGLQKDIETFILSLENTNDITTLSDSETKLGSLSQRLDSILQKLDGSSQ